MASVGDEDGGDVIYVAFDSRIEGLGEALGQLIQESGAERFVAPGIGDDAGEILRDIVLPALDGASQVIVMLDRPNANVGFEVGLALGLGKKVALLCFGREKPAWLDRSLFRSYRVEPVRDAAGIRAALGKDVWVHPLAAEPLQSGSPSIVLSLCPFAGRGADLRVALGARQRAEHDLWNESEAGQQRFTLKDLPSLTRGARLVVWTLPQGGDDADERDGIENTNNGVLAGWVVARELRSFPDVGSESAWEHVRKICVVLSENGPRIVQDLRPLQLPFKSLTDFHALADKVFPAYTRHTTPLAGEIEPAPSPRRTRGWSARRWGAVAGGVAILAASLVAWRRVEAPQKMAARFTSELRYLDPPAPRTPDQLSEFLGHQREAARLAVRLRRCSEVTAKNQGAIVALYYLSLYNEASALAEDARGNDCAAALRPNELCFIRIMQASLLKMTGKLEQARSGYQVLAEDTENRWGCQGNAEQRADAWNKVGHLAVEMGRYQDARQAFQRALTLNGGDNETASAHLGLGKLAISAGDQREADQELATAKDTYAMAMGQAHLLVARAEWELRRGRFSCARRCYQQAGKLYDRDVADKKNVVASTVQKGNIESRLASLFQTVGRPRKEIDEAFRTAKNDIKGFDPDEGIRMALSQLPPLRPQALAQVTQQLESPFELLLQTQVLAYRLRETLTAEVGQADPCERASTADAPSSFEDSVANGDLAQARGYRQRLWACPGRPGAVEEYQAAVRWYGDIDCVKRAASLVVLGQLALEQSSPDLEAASARLREASRACVGVGAPMEATAWEPCTGRRPRRLHPSLVGDCACGDDPGRRSAATVESADYPAELVGSLDLLRAGIARLRARPGDATEAERCYESASAELALTGGPVGEAIVNLERAAADRRDSPTVEISCATLEKYGAKGLSHHYRCPAGGSRSKDSPTTPAARRRR
jgi:tetratricopeptide (TPR) repeat protein